MVPTAALATMMQTPRPPCSAPHRPAPGDRRGFRRPRTSRGPVACRVLAGWGSSGWAGIRRVGGPSAAARPGRHPARSARRHPARSARWCRARRGHGRPSRRHVRAVRGPAGRARPGRPHAGAPGWPSRGDPTLPRVWPPAAPGLPWPPAAGLPWLPAAGPVLGGTAPGGLPGTRPGVGGGPGTRPRGLAPGSPPYGLFGRVSRHRGSLIGASDVSRCGLVTGTRR